MSKDISILVLGDSIQWGQGLLPKQKFHTQVAKFIGSKHPNFKVHTQVLAHSGAIIGVCKNKKERPLNGEIPTDNPTILQQAAMAINPNNVDLVLVDGGINDINVRTIISPLTSKSTIIEKSKKHCHDHMKMLLKELIKFKKAKIIVTGYYPMVTHESDLLALTLLLAALGLAVAGPGGLIVGGLTGSLIKDKMASNCRTFAKNANADLKAAVDEVNKSLKGQKRIFLAIPPFGPKNAIFAPSTWLWGLNGFSPQDPVAKSRSTSCSKAGSKRTNIPMCKIASLGHPNPTGAKAYAKVITQLIQKNHIV